MIRATAVALLAVVAAVTSGSAAEAVKADAAIERAVVERVNAVRREHGLSALQVDQAVARVARDYSCRMAREGFFSHVAPSGETMADRLRAARTPVRSAGENIAKLTNVRDPADRVVKGWMKSEGHRENILTAQFTRTGVGVCQRGPDRYFVQIFVTPASG